MVRKIDELTWQENKVRGFDNHLWQVCCSDFKGNPGRFAEEAGKYLESLFDAV